MQQTPPQRPAIDFDRAHGRGYRMYDGAVGRWWQGRTQDEAHRRAYREVLRWVPHASPGAGLRITDYACGPGNFLMLMRRAFMEARLRGLDASALMIEEANARMRTSAGGQVNPVHLARATLPDFELAAGTEDVVTFLFPNLVGVDSSVLNAAERTLARRLSREVDDEGEGPASDEDPQEIYDAMCAERAVALNVRHLLSRGGSFIKVEYGDCEVDEMTSLSQRRSAFEAGSSALRFGSLDDEPGSGVAADDLDEVLRRGDDAPGLEVFV